MVLTVLTAGGPLNSLGDVLADAAIFGALGAFGCLTSTTSVRVSGGDLVLVRLLAVTTVALPEVVGVRGENGLEVETKDGQTLTHIGYGSSLLGTMTGNRRATHVAARVRQRLPESGPSSSPVRGTIRRARPALCLFVVLPLAYSILGAVVHG